MRLTQCAHIYFEAHQAASSNQGSDYSDLIVGVRLLYKKLFRKCAARRPLAFEKHRPGLPLFHRGVKICLPIS